MNFLTALSIGVLFGVGLYLMLGRNMVQGAIGLILISNAVNLFLLVSGSQFGVNPPNSFIVGERSDAFPQALILTAIVISMGGLIFLLTLIYALYQRQGSTDSDEIKGLRR